MTILKQTYKSLIIIIAAILNYYPIKSRHKAQLFWVSIIFILFLSTDTSIMVLHDSIAHETKGTVSKIKKADGLPNCIGELEYGSINWTNGVVRAKGRNKNLKKAGSDNKSDIKSNTKLDNKKIILESATDNARGHLFEILNSIRLSLILNKESPDEDSTNSAYLDKSDHLMDAKIKKKAVGAKVVETKQITGQSIEVVLQTDIYGEFLDSVLPNEIREISDIKLFDSENEYIDDQESFLVASNHNSSQELEYGAGKIFYETKKLRYTGLIIDARGIRFKPVICPIIISEQGEEIYSPEFIDRKYAVERGVCSYICNPNPLVLSQKVGVNPLTIKGLREDGESIVVSMSDADKIQKIAERHFFLKRCNVLILISP